jgi:predicted nucleic acid-binding protein
VDAAELLLGDAPFIADTSAWWRFSSLPAELAGLIKDAVADERLWTTPIVRMEILYSARSTSEYIELETELDALRILRNDRAVTKRRDERDRRASRAQRRIPPRAADRRPNRCRRR